MVNIKAFLLGLLIAIAILLIWSIVVIKASYGRNFRECGVFSEYIFARCKKSNVAD